MFTEIAFTAVPSTDIQRSRAFYEGVLGLKLSMESAGGMWVEYQIGNHTFGVGCYGDQWKSSPDGICVALEADNFDAEVARLKSLGVKFVMEAMPTPICTFTIIEDPDGNRLMIHKRK